jgi:hypothetical protein
MPSDGVAKFSTAVSPSETTDRPYPFLLHPQRPWLDKILSWILTFLIPFKWYPPKTAQATLKMKEGLQKRSLWLNQRAIYGGTPIVESIIKVSRQRDIVVQWEILKKKKCQRQT